jgi:transcriptional regulator GlxA family with amidase domain
MLTIGIVIFDGVEELDFVGPYEVFTMSNEVVRRTGQEDLQQILLIAEDKGPVTCNKKLRVESTHSLDEAPDLDVLLVPGGQGTRREMKNQRLVEWIANAAPRCKWVTSVCTGALVLGAAGLTQGKRVTTHWAAISLLRETGFAGEVLENVRYVRDGHLVTAAGISAGIDMALWLIGQLHGPDHARLVQRGMEYDPAPPYAALV